MTCRSGNDNNNIIDDRTNRVQIELLDNKQLELIEIFGADESFIRETHETLKLIAAFGHVFLSFFSSKTRLRTHTFSPEFTFCFIAKNYFNAK